MSQKRLIAGGVALAIFLLFILLNLQRATINFFWIAQTEMPVAIAVLFAFLLGAATAMAFMWFRSKKKDPTNGGTIPPP